MVVVLGWVKGLGAVICPFIQLRLAGLLVLTLAFPGAHASDRIITLAPHLTDMMLDLQGHSKLVGVSRFSKLPEDYASIPVVGDAFQLNIEQILELKPDLILAWQGGAPRTVAKLEKLGFRIKFLGGDGLEAIATNYVAVGDAIDNNRLGRSLATHFSEALKRLNQQYQRTTRKRVFMQIAEEQLFTVNDTHFMGQAISICGGENIFAKVPVQIPVVSLESVLAAAPEIIVLVRSAGEASQWGARWLEYLPKTRVAYVDADLLSRPSRRILEGIEALCRVVHYEG